MNKTETIKIKYFDEELPRLEFIGGLQMLLDNEFGGLTLRYRAINGENKKKNPLNPEDNDKMKVDFKELQDLLKEIQ